MSELADRQCVPCRAGAVPLTGDQIAPLTGQIDDWDVVDGHHLRKSFSFSNFREALGFVNAVGDVAEAQNHHPDLELGWGRAAVSIWTHKIDGLTESDFVLAAKIDRIGSPS
jgi:4a-hydroxytetrahydrobiopterin dehydratase